MNSVIRKYLIAVAMSLAATFQSASAQSWPSAPVRIIVPFPPGGNSDNLARVTADQLSKLLRGTFIVENKPGASGEIAARQVATSAPDGYMLLWATLPQMAILPALKSTTYDPVKDFAPISIVASNPLVLAVGRSVPAQSLKEFVSYVKARPNGVFVASAGNGSVSHLAMMLFSERAGLRMVHVPYKGGVPAVADVVAGRIPATFANPAEVIPHSKSGAIRLLAVTGARRTPLLPDLSTVAELGYPDYRAETWNGLVAPRDTPADIVARIAAAVATASKDEAFLARLASLGLNAIANTPTEFAAVLGSDLHAWAEVVRVSGAKLD